MMLLVRLELVPRLPTRLNVGAVRINPQNSSACLNRGGIPWKARAPMMIGTYIPPL